MVSADALSLSVPVCLSLGGAVPGGSAPGRLAACTPTGMSAGGGVPSPPQLSSLRCCPRGASAQGGARGGRAVEVAWPLRAVLAVLAAAVPT